jgi:hypothetical protein
MRLQNINNRVAIGDWQSSVFGGLIMDDEVQKKIEIAGAVGAFVGFASGVGLMALVGIIF